jgi:choline dehydrogenase
MTCYATAAPIPASTYNHGECYAALPSPGRAGTWPDVQLFPVLLPVAPPGCPAPPGGFALVASVVAPDSRGTVRLASADPAAAPLIDPGFLREPADLTRLAEGLTVIRAAADGAAFTRLGATEAHPGPATGTLRLREWARRTVGSYYHPAGTCQIGTRPDDGAVTDPALRVCAATPTTSPAPRGNPPPLLHGARRPQRSAASPLARQPAQTRALFVCPSEQGVQHPAGSSCRRR